jgi:hypothetical protein
MNSKTVNEIEKKTRQSSAKTEDNEDSIFDMFDEFKVDETLTVQELKDKVEVKEDGNVVELSK